MKLKILFAIMLTMIPTLAFSPTGHVQIANEFFDNYPNNLIAMECRNYKREFIAGSIFPDITVFYYFTEGGKNYLATHNWNYQQRVMIQAVTPAERCFAHGISSHLIADATVHNGFIADEIADKLIPNIPLHPLLEAQDELYLQRVDRINVNIMIHSLDVMFENDRLMQISQNALGQETPLDVRKQTRDLTGALGNFYNSAYVNPNPDVLYSIYRNLANTIEINPQGMIDSRQQAVINHNRIFTNFNERFKCEQAFCPAEPHGFNRLNNAEASAALVRVLAVIVIIAIAIIILSKRKK